MDLEQRVANIGDAAVEGLWCTVAVLVAPRAPAVLGLLGIARALPSELVLDDTEEAVLGAKHVRDDLAQWPLALPRYRVQILVEHAGERTAQIAVGMVVLAEDALRLARWRRPHRGEPHREVAQLVLSQKEREPKTLVVVLAPHPRPIHLRIGKIDGRANERLDGLGNGRHLERDRRNVRDGLRRDEVDDLVQVARLLPHAELPVRARPLASDRLEVLHLLPRAERV